MEGVRAALVGLACLVGCSGAGNQQPTVFPKQSQGLELRLAAVQKCVVDVAFTNKGARPVWFRRNFVIDNIGVRTADGARVDRLCITDEGIPDTPDDQPRSLTTPPSEYQSLGPNESDRWQEDLRDCFDIKRPGDYVMSASWEGWDATPPPPPPGAILVKGPIESLSVKFHLESQCPLR
jgi:hypothetical protein